MLVLGLMVCDIGVCRFWFTDGFGLLRIGLGCCFFGCYLLVLLFEDLCALGFIASLVLLYVCFGLVFC